jgi:hypothetical protein
MTDMASMHAQHTATGPAAEAGGLAVAASGMLLSPHRTTLQPGHPTAFTFRILDHTGQPVTSLSSSLSASCT